MNGTLEQSINCGTHQASDPASTQCDHGNVDVTSLGFYLVCWAQGTGNKNVEGRVFQINPLTDIASPVSGVLSLALAGTSVYASESCAKPEVAVTGPERFAVTYERQNTAGGAARLEVTRVYRLAGEWLVDQGSPGIGHVWNASNNPGQSDCNVRPIHLREGFFFASSTHETANTGSSPHVRTYQLRLAIVNAATIGATPTVPYSTTIAGAHWDDANNTVAGGYVLTAAEVLRSGDVLLAYENRIHTGGNYVSSIEIRVLAGPHHASPLSIRYSSSTLITVTDDNLAYRRPTLRGMHPRKFHASATVSGAHQVLMAYGLENISTPGDSQAKLAWVNVHNGAITVTPVTWRPNVGLDADLDKLGSASPIRGLSIKCGIAVADLEDSAGRQLSVQHTDGTHEFASGLPLWVDRPFSTTWAYGEKEYVILSIEGSDTGVTTAAQRFVSCLRVR